MIAGPMFSNFMSQVAPAYGTNPFTAPPSNMVNGTPTRQNTPATQRGAPAPAPAPTTEAPAPAPSNKDNGKGNG
jgi:hypothetical protein